MFIQLFSDKVLLTIDKAEAAQETLEVALDKVRYGEQYLSVFQNSIYAKPIEIESRRYIGSKAKLTAWIMEIMNKEAGDALSFFDGFADIHMIFLATTIYKILGNIILIVFYWLAGLFL